MARKYQKIKNKISPITIVSILTFILVVVLLIVFLHPSREKQLFLSYQEQAATQGITFNDEKFGSDHRFRFIDSLEDRWFGIQPGLFSVSQRNEVSIVFFGTSSDANSITQIQNVHGLLYGVEKLASKDPSWKPSDLYLQLGDKVSLYYYDQNASGLADLMETLNEHYDEKMVANGLPLVICFINGEVVEYINPTGDAASGITAVRNFYKDILASDAAQALL